MDRDQSTPDEEDPTDAREPAEIARAADAHRADSAHCAPPAPLADNALLAAAQDPEAAGSRVPPGGSQSWQICALLAAVVLVLAVILVLAFTWVVSFTCPRTSPTVPPSSTPGTPENTTAAHTACPKAMWQGSEVSAKLLAHGAALKNDTLPWRHEEGIQNVHLSQGLRYDNVTNELVVDKAGLYCIFLELKLNPTVPANTRLVRGQVSLILKPKPPVADLQNSALTVDLHPRSMEEDMVQGYWSCLLHLRKGHRLSVRLHANLHGGPGALISWELSQRNNATTTFGLFRVNP